MQPDRREFLKHLGLVTGAGAIGMEPALVPASSHSGPKVSEDAVGVLVDLTLCVGCRLCEHACKTGNGFEAGPVEAYDDQSVFAEQRRPAPDAYTVINAYPNPSEPGKQVFVKSNCLHCNHPACVSACIVGALRKKENGPVTYDAWKCIGCRYCMVACPFQIPTYEYDDAFAPKVQKCELCFDELQEGGMPACVKACPRQTMVFGKRSELLKLAHERIRNSPDKYVDHVYGEHEVGGTSWLYLSSVPFDKVGFIDLPDQAPPETTEAIQHGVFKYGLPPLALYGVLGGLMYLTKPRHRHGHHHEHALEHAHAKPMAVLAGVGAGAATAGSEFWEDYDSPDMAHAVYEEALDEEEEHVDHDHEPAPVARKFLTPGVMVLLAIAATGLFFGLKRFIFGLESTTNLDQQHPWGLWIGIDVATGVALAAGGFTTAFLTHVIHRERYHALSRPALLTAMLGYTFVVIGLQADLGRYYNVWHPMFMWQGNSVLFEVGICVMCYLNVLYLEFAPIVCERLMQQTRFPKIAQLAAMVNVKLSRLMALLIIAGCMLSCLHQSSLGNLMVIAPSKLHPLWWTPLSPLLFLLSAVAVGFPMAIFESLLASRSFKMEPEMDLLGPLGRFVPYTLGFYLVFKIGDMISRGTYTYLLDGTLQSTCWLIEVGLGVVLPILMFASPKVRRTPMLLFVAAALAVFGVLLNRVNVFLVGYNPPYATQTYFPSVGEFAVTIGLVATLVLVYRAAVLYLPVISQPKPKVVA